MDIIKKCSKCKKHLSLSCFGKHSKTKDGFRCCCKICHVKENKTSAHKNIDKVNYRHRKWSKKNRGKVNANTAKYFASKLQRTPQWLTKEQLSEIKEYYILAKNLKWLNNSSGPFEVDHIIPLQGENVSGLHVPWNLRIVSRSENRSKSNNIDIKVL